MTVILIELAAVTAGFYVAGWRGALAAFGCVIVGHVAGHALALASLRRAGYVVEWRKDGRGVARWRVGVRDAHTAPVAEPVTWFVPAVTPGATSPAQYHPTTKGCIPPQPRPILPSDRRG